MFTLASLRKNAAWAVALCVAGCGTVADHRPDAPDPPASAPTDAPDPAPDDEAAAPTAEARIDPGDAITDWQDPDALPQGAKARLDSRRHLAIFASELAVNDEGTVATRYDGRGAVEIRLDGSIRQIGMAAEAKDLRYRAGGALVGATPVSVFAGIPPRHIEIACEYRTAMSPDSKRVLCVGSGDAPVLRVFDLDSGALQWERTVKGPVAEWAVSNEGAVAVSDSDQQLWRFAPGGGAPTATRKGRYESLAFAGDLLIAELYGPGSILHWIAPDGSVTRETGPLSFAVVRSIVPHPDGKTLFVSAYEESGGSIKRVDAKTGAALSSWTFTEYEYDLEISPNGRFVAAVGSGGELLVLDLEKKGAEAVARTARPFEDALSMVSTRSGDRMILSRTDGLIQIFDMRAAKEVARTRVPEGISRDIPIAFSPDETQFVAANAYGALTVMDAATAKPVCTYGDAAATWLYWIENRIVAVHVGVTPDDWPYAGSVTVLDPKCKLVVQHENPGAAYGFGVGAKGLEIGFDDGTVDKDGERVRVMRVAVPSGKLEPVRELPIREAVEAAVGPGPIPPSPSAEGHEEQRLSADGRFIAILRLDDANQYHLRCEHAETRNIHRQHPLPPEIFPNFTIAGDGSWVAVNDRASTLIYPCK